MTATHTTALEDLTVTYMTGRLKRGEIAKTTHERHSGILRMFAAHYGARPVERLSVKDIDRWREERSHTGAATRQTEWSVVRCFARWLVAERVIRRDPFEGRRGPKVPRHTGRALTADECEALERVLPDERAWAIYSLMRWVGLRRTEVATLQMGDWDRRAGVLRVIGKGSHERDEPVPAWVAARLKAYVLVAGQRGGALIQRQDGSGGLSPARIGDLMREWMSAAGIKARAFDGRACHSLRHTIASELVESGADVMTVQALLGHVTLAATQVYLRRASVARVLAALERAKLAA
jgi:site-specific recombinase XerC